VRKDDEQVRFLSSAINDFARVIRNGPKSKQEAVRRAVQ